MIGNLEPEENVMSNMTQDELWETISRLGWDVRNDDIVIEIGGCLLYTSPSPRD